MAKKKMKRNELPPSQTSESQTSSFEQAMAKLEQTVARLEGGQLGLDESLAQYEHGIKYLKQCYRQLERAQRKIELLAGVDEQGEVRVEPFAEDEMSLEQKQAARGRRRSRPRRDDDGATGTDDPATLF